MKAGKTMHLHPVPENFTPHSNFHTEELCLKK
jgi:hypothetical protein